MSSKHANDKVQVVCFQCGQKYGFLSSLKRHLMRCKAGCLNQDQVDKIIEEERNKHFGQEVTKYPKKRKCPVSTCKVTFWYKNMLYKHVSKVHGLAYINDPDDQDESDEEEVNREIQEPKRSMKKHKRNEQGSEDQREDTPKTTKLTPLDSLLQEWSDSEQSDSSSDSNQSDNPRFSLSKILPRHYNQEEVDSEELEERLNESMAENDEPDNEAIAKEMGEERPDEEVSEDQFPGTYLSYLNLTYLSNLNLT